MATETLSAQFARGTVSEVHTETTKNLCRLSAGFYGALQLWASGFLMNPDGISYLDIGDAFFHGNRHAVLNAYWSPLYPLVLGAVRWALPVKTQWEFPLIHTVNFLIFIVVIACFEFFWSGLLQAKTEPTRVAARQQSAYWLAGYALFVLTMHAQRAVMHVSPDLIVTGVLFLAAGLLLRVRFANSSNLQYAALGATLGVGYLAKAAMLPIATIFFFSVAAMHRPWRLRSLKRFATMLLVFAAISGPFIIALSNSKTRLTFGDSGRLNWAWSINGVTRFAFWKGGEPDSGAPVHPPRQLWHSPDAYEFVSPFSATYPVWYDPTFWYDGVKPHFNFRQLSAAILRNLYDMSLFYRQYYETAFPIVLLLLLAHADHSRMVRDLLHKYWPILLVGTGALLMYCLVNVQPRYIAGFVFLLVGVLLVVSDVLIGENDRMARAFAIALVVAVLPLIAHGLLDSRRENRSARAQVDEALALREVGIGPGEKIGYIGNAFFEYWPKLARVSIVAEIPTRISDNVPSTVDDHDAPASIFWQSPEAVKASIFQAMYKAHVEAVVAHSPGTGTPSGWQPVRGSDLCVKFLSSSQ